VENESYGYRHIWKITYPLIIGGVGQTIINISDTIFLGRLSELALGAAAIAGLYYVTFYMLGVGFSIGSQILIARFDGENDRLKLTQTFKSTTWSLLAIALLTFVFLNLLSSSILLNLIKSKEIYSGTIEFLKYRSLGIFPGFMILLFRSFYSGIGSTKVVGYTTIITAVLNLILNYLLVFGNCGLAKMGIAGSGLASTLSEVFALVFVVAYSVKYQFVARYQLFKKTTFSTIILSKLIKTSAPLMVQVFIALWSWFAFFLIVEKIGERELAISNITRNVYMLLMICLMGFSNATNTIISNLLGQNRKEELLTVMKRIIFLSLSTTFLVVLLNLIFWRYSVSLFTSSEELTNSTFGCIVVISGSSLLFSVSYILLSAVSGSGGTFATLIIEAITLLFYLIATYFTSIFFKTSIEIVWCTEYVYFLAMGIISYYYIRYRVVKPIKNS
jgi:putative MATE family efflux protein